MNTKENSSIVYLSLGSNLGDREVNLQNAITKLAAFVEVVDLSNIYETEPQELKKQRSFLNMTVKILTQHKPYDILRKIHKIEKELKRKRIIKYGPRTIDIDIIYFDDIVLQDEKLTIPHSKMQNRSFVLKPLSEIDQGYIHPINGKTSTQMHDEIKPKQPVNIWKKTR